jgi:hypothetical protein
MCLLGSPIAANATPIALTNSSFESLALGDGASSSSLPGWTRFLSVATFNPTMANFPSEAYDGQNVALFSGGATLTQTLGPLAYGTYTLTAAFGNPLGAPLGSLGLSLRRGTTFLSLTSTSFTAPADGAFSLMTRVYEVSPTNVNGNYFGDIINIFALSTGSGAQVALDDVRLDLQPLEEASAVPEPASLGLLGVGVFALGISHYARFGRARSSQRRQARARVQARVGHAILAQPLARGADRQRSTDYIRGSGQRSHPAEQDEARAATNRARPLRQFRL